MNTFTKLLLNRRLQIICNTAILLLFTYSWWAYKGLDPLADNFETKEQLFRIALIMQSILVLAALINFYFLFFRPERFKKMTAEVE
mgnify:CR=1 FL=1